MPKQKTHKGLRKRIKITARGKVSLDYHGKSVNFTQRIIVNSDDVRTWIAVRIAIGPQRECIKNHVMIRIRYLRIDGAGINFSMA